MNAKVRVVILEDHQSTVDGYLYRLGQAPDVEVVGTAMFGEELEPLLAHYPADVLLLDLNVKTSPTNPTYYPVLHLIPRLLKAYPNLAVLIISMHAEHNLIRSIMQTGVNGYILKDDYTTIRELGSVVRSVSKGGLYLSPQARQAIRQPGIEERELLTARQLEIFSLCAAHPELTTLELAQRLGLSDSTVRNTLSEIYERLGVNNRASAVLKAQQLGLIAGDIPLRPEDLLASDPEQDKRKS